MTAMIKAKCFASSLMPQFAECVGASIAGSALSALDSSRFVVFPGFCDVHVHFREPGFSYKETIATGSRASARGGYTAVCTMPNLNPVPDSVEALTPTGWEEEAAVLGKRQIPGSVAFVPGAAGLLLAGEVVRDLTGFSRA